MRAGDWHNGTSLRTSSDATAVRDLVLLGVSCIILGSGRFGGLRSKPCKYLLAVGGCPGSFHDLALLGRLFPMMLAASPRPAGGLPNGIGPPADPLEPFIRHLFLLRGRFELRVRGKVPTRNNNGADGFHHMFRTSQTHESMTVKGGSNGFDVDQQSLC